MTEPITFDAATAVSTRGDGTYEVDLLSQYAVGGSKPNGGYLLACPGRAAWGPPRGTSLYFDPATTFSRTPNARW